MHALTAGYLAVGGETVLPSNHNPPLEDISAGLTARLMRSGAGGMTGQLKAADGVVGAPGVTFGSALSTGLYKTTSGFGVAVAGALVAEFGAGGILSGVIAQGIAARAVQLAKIAPSGITGSLIGQRSNAAVAITGAANNGSGLIRLTVGSTAAFTTSEYETVAGVLGTTEANGNWQITVIDGTHIDLSLGHYTGLPSVFTNAYVSGGTIGGGIEYILLGAGLAMSGRTLSSGAVAGPMSGAQGLVITNNSGTPNSIIDITADQAVMLASGIPKYATAISVSVNTSTVGAANGLDAGSRAASTWYNLFLISNGTTTAGLASLSATAPTMPSGYTYLVRVGAMRTDGSGNFLRSKQVGNKTTNLTSAANLPAIVTGNIGATYTAVSISNFVPPTAVSIFVSTWTQSNGVGPSWLGVAGYQAGTAPSTQPYPEWETEVNATPVLMAGGTTEIVLLSTNIFTSSSAMTTANVAAAGWRDKVNAT